MFDPNNYVYFVFVRPFNASYGFTSYTDSDGELCMIADSKDKEGNPIPRRFQFSQKDRVMRIPKNQKDRLTKNVSVVDFLKNHPECRDSPNGVYTKDKNGKEIQSRVFFAVLDTDKDAEKAMTAKEERLEAENYAIGLKGADLIDVGALIGVIGKSEVVTKHKVMEYAGNDPKTFLELVGRKDRKAISLIRQALSCHVLVKKGNVISWEDTVLGSDEERAAKYILDDTKLAEALEDAIKRTK